MRVARMKKSTPLLYALIHTLRLGYCFREATPGHGTDKPANLRSFHVGGSE